MNGSKRSRPEPSNPPSSFPASAWGVLAYTVLVAVWGAYVRATGAGAGCGNHWPLCNGEVLPRAPAVETMVELSHRLTSGLVGVLVLLLAIWAVRRFGWRHRVTAGALAALALTVVEALIGAALVRFDLVGDNPSAVRGVVIAAHLVNTLLLLGALALTAAWASGARAGAGYGAPRLRGQGAAGWLLAAGLGLVCVLGASGAVTALGDTLYPVASLTEKSILELPPTAQLLIRLRVLHPFIAVGVGIYLVAAAALVRLLRPGRTVARLALGLAVLFTVELLVGIVNVGLAAPVWLQLVHLGLAYLVWIDLVLLAAAALSEHVPRGSLAGGGEGPGQLVR
ncbi:MAG: COX15/CtaA family protein [Acidobacteriota bacterium]|jgi:heme A synthase